MNRKSAGQLLLMSAMSGIFLTVAGCGSQATYYDSHRYATASEKEAGITGWLLVLNNNEINAADMALRKSVTSPVRRYASEMKSQHIQNYNHTLDIARQLNVTPVYTKHSITLENAGKKEIQKLSGYDGINFDRAYITAMVNDHYMALKKLDHKIMSVNNYTLKYDLIQTRKTVMRHLQEAREIQKHL